jgi:hypothetical protein
VVHFNGLGWLVVMADEQPTGSSVKVRTGEERKTVSIIVLGNKNLDLLLHLSLLLPTILCSLKLYILSTTCNSEI